MFFIVAIKDEVTRMYSLICVNLSSICFLSGYFAMLSHFGTVPELSRLPLELLACDRATLAAKCRAQAQIFNIFHYTHRINSRRCA